MFAGRFSTSSVGLVGVDFGARGIKLLQVREHSGQLQLLGAGRIDTPSSGTAEEKQKLISERLRLAVASGGFTGRRCVVSLPRADVQIHSLRLPRMPDEELHEAVAWEASQRLGWDRATMEADFLRTGATAQSAENREEVLLIAASHKSIDPCVQTLLEAGLRPVAIDAGCAALARTFSRHCRRDSDRNTVRAVLEIGATGSIMMILRGDQIAFCKSIEIGGRQLDLAVAEHLQLDPKAAQDLRGARLSAAARGETQPAGDTATDRAVYEAVRPLLGDLAKEVTLCLRYYGVTFRGHPPERLILAGGDGLEPRLDTMITQTCKVPVAFDDMQNTLDGLVKQIVSHLHQDSGPGPSWAVAAGLSMRSLGARKHERRHVSMRVKKGRVAA